MGGKLKDVAKKHGLDILGWGMIVAAVGMLAYGQFSDYVGATLNLLTGEEVVKVEEMDICSQHYLLGSYSNEQTDVRVNRVPISEDGVLNLGVDESVTSDYYGYIQKACDYLNSVFEVINPKIKLAVKKGSDSSDEVYVYKADKNEKNYNMAVYSYFDYSSPARCENQMELRIYPKADRQNSSYNKVATVHEIMHILGLNDHNKSHYEGIFKQAGCGNMTIMNYGNLSAIGALKKYGICQTDYYALYDIYGAKTDEEAVEFGYKSLEHYIKEVEDCVEKFCVMGLQSETEYEKE